MPGVGPLVAITHKTAMDDPNRIAKSKAAGALFGLTPKSCHEPTWRRHFRLFVGFPFCGYDFRSLFRLSRLVGSAKAFPPRTCSRRRIVDKAFTQTPKFASSLLRACRRRRIRLRGHFRQPALLHHRFGLLLVNIWQHRLLKREIDLAVFGFAARGARRGKVSFIHQIGEQLAIGPICYAQEIVEALQRRGTVAQNVALSVKADVDKRSHHRLEVGVDIPKPDEIKQIVAALSDHPGGLRPLLLTAIFTGLRASELRGLRWLDVDFKRPVVHVKQRADRYNAVGKPKSKAGDRKIPIGPDLANMLREWKLACPKGEAGLVFPTRKGRIEHHSNMVRAFKRVVLAAGLKTATGKPKYTGLHSLRHFYASWCINLKKDGGLELPVKIVQTRLGHATLAMTMDRYGHLFPSKDDGSEMAEAERALLGNPFGGGP